MALRRSVMLLSMVALLLSGLALPPAVGAVGGWTPTAPRPPRADGSPASTIATTLTDGRVLVAESYYGPTRGVAQRYDPAADRWAEAAPFDPHNGHATPTLLPDGRLLFVGGVSLRGVSPSSMVGLAAAQVYDPAADTWTSLAPMREARRDHTATLLPDGTVLVVSGDAGPPLYAPRPIVGVERYDPRTNQWTDAAPLARARFGHGAALLPDGRVLVFGGYGDATAAIYDPAADRWSPAADLPWGQRHDYEQRAVALPDGRILALAPGRPEQTLALAVYDPIIDRWTLAPPPPPAAFAFSPLPGGRLLAIGAETQIYDPAVNAWAGAPAPGDSGAPPNAAQSSVATPLRDGRVLLVGARGGQIYADDPPHRACFAETGQCVSGRFLDHWLANGGLARNGFPLGDVRIEVLEDGNAYQVQYFERVRMELHTENASPYDVLVGHYGRRVLRAQFGGVNNAVALFEQALAPAAPLAGASYFPETGHNLGGGFREYWLTNGGLAQFGFPITEERRERLEDGNEYTVQYFERVRMEHHPENAPPYDILLGQFGRRILAENALLTGDFGALYFADQRVRDLLGAPVEAARSMPGATQEFERGRMFWLGGLRTSYWGGEAGVISVFVGGPQAGTLANYLTGLAWPDTWREGDDVGGGPGPQPGLYEPKRGFGNVWRLGSGLFAPGLPPNADVRDRLGYAVAADETGYALRWQPFQGGQLLSTPDERVVYAIFTNQVSNGSALRGVYERYALPPR